MTYRIINPVMPEANGVTMHGTDPKDAFNNFRKFTNDNRHIVYDNQITPDTTEFTIQNGYYYHVQKCDVVII